MQRRLGQLGAELGKDLAPAESPRPIAAPGRHSRHAPSDSHLSALAARLTIAPLHLALLLIAVLAALVLALWLTTRAAPELAPVAGVASPEPVVELPESAPAASAGSDVVTVHVAGEVRKPGVVELPAGSRVVDAVAEAGGARKGAELATVNLARVLVDGEQIVLGKAGSLDPGGAGPASPAGAPGGKISLSSATAAQLEALPGIGPVTAARIIDWRSAHGGFRSLQQLLDVPGIGEKRLSELEPHVVP